MKKTKTQKGITLVALIITIIVLLILAVVAITAIQNDGIFGHANNAATKFNDAQGNEQNDLNTYEDLLNRYAGGSSTVGTPEEDDGDGDETPVAITWTQSGTTITSSNGDSIPVGATVSGYDETKGGEVTVGRNVDWKVLGAENGKLLIISATNVANNEAPNTNLRINSNVYTPYGQGTLADGVRSVEMKDFNRIKGYDPETANYGAGTLYEYGNVVTYTIDEDGYLIWSDTKNNVSGKASYPIDLDNGGYYPNARSESGSWFYLDSAGDTFTDTATYYSYSLTLETDDPAYIALFDNAGDYNNNFDDNEEGVGYWIDTSYFLPYVNDGGWDYGLYQVREKGLNCWNTANSVADSGGPGYGPTAGVRAVVTIKSSATFSYDDTTTTLTIS